MSLSEIPKQAKAYWIWEEKGEEIAKPITADDFIMMAKKIKKLRKKVKA